MAPATRPNSRSTLRHLTGVALGQALSLAHPFAQECPRGKVRPARAKTAGCGGNCVHAGREGCRISQVIRKRTQQQFGWGKMVGRIRQTVFRGLQRVDQQLN